MSSLLASWRTGSTVSVDHDGEQAGFTLRPVPDPHVPGTAGGMNTLGIVRDRLLAALASPVTPVDVPRPDGTWPDIDYAGEDVADWQPAEHLRRLAVLARDSPAEALRALDGWLELDLHCPNWWYNQLGAPRLLGDAALLLERHLSADRRSRVARVLHNRATWERMTGQNLLWTAQVAIRRGLLTDDLHVVSDAFGRVEELLAVGEGEGIQPDHSFHQHGAQLYSGGYGHHFARDAAALAALAAGTPLAFSGRALAVLADYLLDGQRWMVHGGRYDIACMGRESSRRGNSAQARELAAAARALADAPRRQELADFADRLDSGKPLVVGARYFWRSDYLAVHRPGWSAAVKLSSTRTVPSETANGEGLKSLHLCDGFVPLWRTDREYPELWPVWDWRHLAGTTTVYRTGPLHVPAFGQDTGGSRFAGGLSDGEYGLAAMHLRRDGLEARKAWFFFADEYVALGAGISSGDPDAPVHTTIDQTALTGQVVCGSTIHGPGTTVHGPGTTVHGPGTTVHGPGTTVCQGARRLHHDGVTYVFPEPATVTIRTGLRRGRWADINRSQSDAPLSARVLELWIDHGVRPGDASYAYIVVPGEAGAPEAISVLANTPRLQAVRHGGLGVVHAVFHEPGVLRVPGGPDIAVDRPALLQLREAGDRLSLSTAGPYGHGDSAGVSIHRGGAPEVERPRS
ncbi:polysaccharide lyase family 8 super-sandwich domain-containing protein [Nonomuraea basaltis]|uniref:polysaccharide lyase family 8 super-sandwich domain-containing protein n=1 Tax=Nonomuraea basaltis TaxID=2495887 RepID=UPI001981C12E|nr:polysaccharide lyase family 8 super-sandwich domain-containing protein [Nonomuraea basaltis]